MTESEERDDRTFPQRVEMMNVAFLVRVPTKMVERFAQLVEDDINEVEGKLVFPKVSTNRLYIKEADPRDRDDRDHPTERRRFGSDR